MRSDLRKDPATLLYNLIEEANPGFQAIHPIANLAYGVPAAQAVVAPSVSNTAVVVKAKNQTTSIGRQRITYQRLNLAALFRGQTLAVSSYAAGTLAFADFLTLFNKTYGMNFTTSDLGAGDLTSGSAIIFTATPGSLCYTGSFTVTWTRSKRVIGDVVAAGPLAARKLPSARIAFVGTDGTVQGESLVYDGDFSAAKSIITGMTSGTYATGNNTVANLVNSFNTVSTPLGTTFSTADAATTKFGLGGLTYTKDTQPADKNPDFASVLVISAGSTVWFAGRILIHYN